VLVPLALPPVQVADVQGELIDAVNVIGACAVCDELSVGEGDVNEIVGAGYDVSLIVTVGEASRYAVRPVS